MTPPTPVPPPPVPPPPVGAALRSGTARHPGLPCALAALAAVVVLTACSGAPAPAGPSAPASPARTAAPGPSAARPALEVSPVDPLPAPAPWRAGPGEVRPEVKQAAARAVEVAGTWAATAPQDERGPEDGPGLEGAGEALVERLAAADLLAPGADRAALAAALQPLAAPEALMAATAVVYPQYGGLTADAASVMVVARQERRGRQGEASQHGATLDVRLSPSPDGAWRVTAVQPPAPRPAGAAPSPLALEVLASPRVELPEDAAADVRAGAVGDEALAVLLGLAAAHEVAVSVARTGHPAEVFGTDRLSNHTRGRALDVWRVDGRLVVDPASLDVVEAAMRAAGAAGATEVGGPVDLDGPAGPAFFSDDLHADHLHIGLTEGEEPIGPTG